MVINYFDISDLDRDHEWEQYFLEKCGINYSSYCSDRNLLTRNILELVVDEIVNEIETSKLNLENGFKTYKFDWVLSIDDIHTGYQILGLLLLDLDLDIPKEVSDSISISTDWNYDKMRQWSADYINFRKANLKLFRKKILYKRKKI